MEFDTTIEILRALEDHGVRYALVGGVAINFQGLARATVDMDLFVAGEFHIDTLTRLGETFGFEDIETEAIEIGDVRARVATPRMLYRMAKDTVRMRDRADAERLLNRFGPSIEDTGED